MPLVISNVNYEDKDLDWFLDDNPLNKVLYARLVELDDSLDFDAIFNEAYKKCIRVYAEKHPERNCRARFGLSYNNYFDDEEIYSWHCAITMLRLNYELCKNSNEDKDLSLFINLVCNFLPERCGFKKTCNNIIEDHFRCYNMKFYVSYIEKKYDFKYEKIHSAFQVELTCDYSRINFFTCGFTQVGIMNLIESIEDPREEIKLLDYIEEQYKLFLKKEENQSNDYVPF